MISRWILASLAAVFLTTAVPATTNAGSDVAGTVPRLLTAVSDRDARCLECTLGDAVADAVRFSLGTDIAIVCGGDLIHNLLPGEITYDGLGAVFKEDRTLAVVSVTPKELRTILEAGVSHTTLNQTETIDIAASAYDGFPQISGFTLKYDASALPGERLREIRLSDKKLNLDDDQTTLRLAASDFMLSGGYDLPAVSGANASELKLSDAMAMYLNGNLLDHSVSMSRIDPMGARNGSLNALFAVVMAMVVMLLIVIGNGQRFKKMYDFSR